MTLQPSTLVGSAPTYRGDLVILGNSGSGQTENKNGGIEFENSSSSSGFGWRFMDPDLGNSNAPLIIQGRANSTAWTDLLTLSGKTGGVVGAYGVGIGSTAPQVSLDISQKTDAVALPVGTTGARPAGYQGMIRYNTDTNGIETYNSLTGWTALVASNGGLVSGVILGTTTAVANPQRLNEQTTGLYSPASGDVSVLSLGNEIARVSATASPSVRVIPAPRRRKRHDRAGQCRDRHGGADAGSFRQWLAIDYGQYYFNNGSGYQSVAGARFATGSGRV